MTRAGVQCATVLVVVFASTGVGAAELIRGPYLQLSTPTSITVVWRTVGESRPVLRYGDTVSRLDQVVNTDAIVTRVSADVAALSSRGFEREQLLYDEPFAIAAERSPTDPEPSTPGDTYQFEATIEGLKPGSKYYYAVYDGDRRIAGGDADHYIATHPPQGSKADARIWVVGDSGTGGGDQRRVFEAMERYVAETERPLDLYLHLGDMAYGDGADREFQRNFFDVYQRTLRNTVCWPTMGNHEGHTSRGISQFGPYYDAYVLPKSAEAGGLPSGTEAYYSFDVGDMHFVCLESHDLDRTPQGAMAQWLVADLEETDANWLIAFWHHPPYTKGSHDSDRERQLIEMRTYLMPILEAGGVDLVLGGHSHIYERSMFIDGAYTTPTTADGVVLDDGDGRPDGDGAYRKSAGLTPHSGTVAIVAGHGGAGVSRKGTMPIMREIIVENGSLVLDVDGDTLNGTMINKSGEVRDTFTVVKRGAVELTPLADPWQPKHDPDAITELRVFWDTADAGKPPADWTVTPTDREMRIEQRAGESWSHAELAASASTPTMAVYKGFDGRVSECETWLEFPAGDRSPAGLVLAYDAEGSHYCYEIDPIASTASLRRVESNGESEVITSRKVELNFDHPIKIELEPVARIIEVQLNDELEYTINLPSGLPAGRLGVTTSPGGAVRFAGLVIEKQR